MTDKAGSRTHLKVADEFRLMKLIEANGQMDGDWWVYNDGWSDERISEETGIGIQPIRSRRQQVFGKMRERQGGRRSKDERTLDELRVQMQALRVADHEQQKRLEALEKVVNLLMSGQNVDRVTADKIKELKNHFSGYSKPTPGM